MPGRLLIVRLLTGWLLLSGAALARDAGPALDALVVPIPTADSGPEMRVLQDAGAEDAFEPEGKPDLSEVVAAAIRRLARSRNREALVHLKAREFPKALIALKESYELNPRDPEVTNNLAFLYQLLGNDSESERYYRETLQLDKKRGIAYLNLADLLSRRTGAKQLAEASYLLARAREIKGNQPGIMIRQARLATSRGRFEAALRFYEEAHRKRPPADAMCLEMGRFHRELGQNTEALAWFGRVDSSKPTEHATEAARLIRELEVEKDALRYGWTRPNRAVPAHATDLLGRARMLRQHQKLEGAAGLLRDAIKLSPLFADAHAELGDVLLALGDRDGAELAYLRAVAANAGDADVVAKLADFYLEADRYAEAAWFFEQALHLRPDRLLLHLRLADAWRAAGNLPRALHQVNRYLSEVDEDAPAPRARALKRDLEATLPLADRTSTPRIAPDGRLIKALRRARALLGRGATDAAMRELGGLPAELRSADVLDLEGRVLRLAGRHAEAIKAFEASLKMQPQRLSALDQLGELLARDPRKASAARRLLLRAVAAGSTRAEFDIARLDLAALETGWPSWITDLRQLGQLDRVAERLSRHLAGRPEATRRQAERLLEAVRGRIGAAWRGVLLTLAGLLILGIAGARRRWGGHDLATLVRRYPEAGPEVQRVLSAIRHEVLKHNTMVVTGLVHAIEEGELVHDKARWCRASLLGDAGAPERTSAASRLREYAQSLTKLGRSHGERLNLKRRDPALSALLRGFKVLEKVAPLLDRADRLGAGGRAKLLRQLRRAAQLLNVEGYEAVRALLDRLRVLDVDAPLLTAIYDRARKEPALAGAAVEPLSMTIDDGSLPCRIAVPRGAFEDILANLIRNAIQSSLRHLPPDQPARVGLEIEREVDFITGLERVVIAICDASPQHLTPEMLRGRYIEEGLGLTADLVSRYEGTLDVSEREGRWTKAVLVKLPLVDESEEAAWT